MKKIKNLGIAFLNEIDSLDDTPTGETLKIVLAIGIIVVVGLIIYCW